MAETVLDATAVAVARVKKNPVAELKADGWAVYAAKRETADGWVPHGYYAVRTGSLSRWGETPAALLSKTRRDSCG